MFTSPAFSDMREATLNFFENGRDRSVPYRQNPEKANKLTNRVDMANWQINSLCHHVGTIVGIPTKIHSKVNLPKPLILKRSLASKG
jgi:hypothetical protein